jgi:hypothetical protein
LTVALGTARPTTSPQADLKVRRYFDLIRRDFDLIRRYFDIGLLGFGDLPLDGRRAGYPSLSCEI